MGTLDTVNEKSWTLSIDHSDPGFQGILKGQGKKRAVWGLQRQKAGCLLSLAQGQGPSPCIINSCQKAHSDCDQTEAKLEDDSAFSLAWGRGQCWRRAEGRTLGRGGMWAGEGFPVLGL